MANGEREFRLDDLRSGVGHSFHELAREGSAWVPSEVVHELRAAERQARLGFWVLLMVAYEAAPGLDPTLAVRMSTGEPLVWWGAFGRRTQVPAPSVVPQRLLADLDVIRLDEYNSMAQALQEKIRAGELYQANLSVPLTARLLDDPAELYGAMAVNQAGEFAAFLDFGERQIVSASPELFFEVSDGRVTCRPMKGTRQPELAPELATDPKELAENIMIVDLLRNDLGRIAVPGSVVTSALMHVETFPTVAQATSTIEAELLAETDLVGVLSALFPCGSVTGAPKVTAMRAIAELETEARGVYCGAIGWLAPGNELRGKFSVPIRTAVVHGTHVTYRTGSGVTLPSDPDAETGELAQKARVLTQLA